MIDSTAGVSIHSPRRSEGRREVPDLRLVAIAFQSTPPAEARGDVSDSVASESHASCFNPLPPPKRGETSPSRLSAFNINGFNPLPPPKRGETSDGRGERCGDPVSIHSPRRSEGRPARDGLDDIGFVVSIHSPRRSEGRQLTEAQKVEARMFQSTPPAEARGDTTSRRRI